MDSCHLRPIFVHKFSLFLSQQVIVTTRTMVPTALLTQLMWLQIIILQATGNPVPACPKRAGPDKMVVVLAPTPYFSWEQCNDLVNGNTNDGKGYLTEPINETKHAGVVTTL